MDNSAYSQTINASAVLQPMPLLTWSAPYDWPIAGGTAGKYLAAWRLLLHPKVANAVALRRVPPRPQRKLAGDCLHPINNPLLVTPAPVPLHCAGVVRFGRVLNAVEPYLPSNESIMEVATPSAANGNGLSPTLEAAQPEAVLEHIANLIETSLGAAREELKALGSLLSDSKHAESLEKVSQFAADTQVALYAQKDRRNELINGHDDTPRKSHPRSV